MKKESSAPAVKKAVKTVSAKGAAKKPQPKVKAAAKKPPAKAAKATPAKKTATAKKAPVKKTTAKTTTAKKTPPGKAAAQKAVPKLAKQTSPVENHLPVVPSQLPLPDSQGTIVHRRPLINFPK